MDNKSLADCKYCKETYCYKCSGDDYDWQEFCSKECEDEFKKEEEAKKEKEGE